MVIKGVVMHTKKGMTLSWEHFSRGKKEKEGILSEVWEIMEKKESIIDGGDETMEKGAVMSEGEVK